MEAVSRGVRLPLPMGKVVNQTRQETNLQRRLFQFHPCVVAP